jgi:hypothetical protein
MGQRRAIGGINGLIWFHPDEATEYPEREQRAGDPGAAPPGEESRWDHQTLFCTKTQHWLLHMWSGGDERWREVPVEAAVAWLRKNGYEAPSSAA